MRPKKVVIHVCGNEQDASVLRFLLQTHALRVVTAATPAEALAAYGRLQPDLALVDMELGGVDLVRRLKALAPYIPLLVLAAGPAEAYAATVAGADMAITQRNLSALELLERIKVMSARKRGPRRGSPAAIRIGDALRKVPAA